jgi:hypothetical protein
MHSRGIIIAVGASFHGPDCLRMLKHLVHHFIAHHFISLSESTRSFWLLAASMSSASNLWMSSFDIVLETPI